MIRGSGPGKPPALVSVAVLVSVALLAAACTGDDDRGVDGGASGGVQSAAPWNPESVPLLDPVAGGSGPLVPVLSGAVVDGSIGTTTSTSPTLRWVAPPGPGPYRFVISDLGPDGGRELWSSGSESLPQVVVPPGVLEHGRAYRWSASDSAGGSLGPLVVRVDVQRADVQQLDDVSDVAVARSSGESVLRWSSPKLATVEGEVGLELNFRASSGQASVGLPRGWTLVVDGAGIWQRLEANPDGTVTLLDDRGVPVIFEPNPGTDGGYRAVWGERQQWPTGSFSTLVANADSTWTVQDTGGTVTTFAPGIDGVSSVAAVWNAARPVPALAYRDGRLVSLTDPVSERSIELTYGGDDGCTDPAVPGGLLCGAQLWDGTRLAFGYRTSGDPASALLTRLVAASGTGSSASVTDVAYDEVGRVAALRSPLAVASVAAGTRAAGPGVTTRVTYDDSGRVASVTSPEPTPGAPPVVRSYRYDTVDDRVVTTVEAPGAPAPLSVVTVDASTFQLLESIDEAGRRSTARWDRATERVEEVTYPGDLLTRYERDDLGVTTRRVGPATVASILGGSAPSVDIGTDLRFEGADDLIGQPMRGLAVTYWADADATGTPVRSEVGPELVAGEVPSPYRFSWSTPPVDGADWSARLTGVLRLPAAGEWTITTGGAPLWIDERPCRPSCAVVSDAARPVRIRIDVTGPTGDVDLQWSGPGVSGNVPAEVLAPAFGRTSRQSQSDAIAAGTPAAMIGRTEYSDPAAGLVSASLSATGVQRRTEVEPYRPADGEFARIVAQTPPLGPARRIEYHPSTEPVADPCGSGEYVQGGLVSTNVAPGGAAGPEVRSSVVVDGGGRGLAARAAESQDWTCTTRDAAGRPVLTEYRGATGEQERSVAVSYAGPSSAGNSDPTVTTSTSTTANGTSLTETVQVDLLGQVIRSVDLWGTVTELTYDPQFPGRVTRNVVRPSGGGVPTTIEYSYGPGGERLSSTLDGQLFATYSYDGAGRVLTVTSGPVLTSYAYDANGRPSSRTVDSPSGRWSESVVLSPTGRALSTVLSGPDSRAEYRYRYDEDARLVGATLDSTIPVTENAWTFEYDPVGDLVARTATRPDGTTLTVRNVFDDASHLRSTDDPQLAVDGGAATYDQLGRMSALGPLSLSYTAAGATERVGHRDGSSVTFATRFGRTVARATSTTGGTTAVRFGDAGVLYDGSGRYLGRQLTGAGAGRIFISPDRSVERVVATGTGNRWFALDGAGVPVGSTALYEPYGRRVDLAAASPTPPSSGAPLQPGFQLVDEAQVGGVEIVPLGPRTYLPTLGSFLQPDPIIGAGTTPYSYADGDPLNGHDPTGSVTEWLNSIGSWFSDNSDTFAQIGSWLLVTVVNIAAAGLSYAAGPAAGTLVSNMITGTWSIGKRLLTTAAVSFVVGWGAGVGATYLSGAIMGWDVSFGTAAGVGAAFAVLGLVRPVYQGSKVGMQALRKEVVGMGFRDGATAAWNTFKAAFGIRSTPLQASPLLSPTGSQISGAKQSFMSQSIIDDLDGQQSVLSGVDSL